MSTRFSEIGKGLVLSKRGYLNVVMGIMVMVICLALRCLIRVSSGLIKIGYVGFRRLILRMAC